ncbi:MAG: hypothetical protein OXU67_10335, partial [Chloroflexota bacterium]|nr:hypothetical protein [Chloroflexota bacterium]
RRVAAGLLVYLIGRRLFGPLVGLVAALLTVLDVELALYEHAVMTETLFALLLLCVPALVLLTCQNGTTIRSSDRAVLAGQLRLPGSIWLKVAGFGLLAGAVTLVRPTGTFLPFLVLLLPGLDSVRDAAGAAARPAWYRQLWYASRRVRLTLVALMGMALIVVPVMVWNKQTHGVFALTSSFQRNMLYPIEEAPERLLQGRGDGDPLLGRVKATISHHPTSPWVGPYGLLQDRFHLSNATLDRLLMRAALDFVLADPLAYIGRTMRRLPRLLTASGTTAVGLVQWGDQQYANAGGPAQLGVSAYDYEADLTAAQVFDQRTEFLRYSHYAWVLLVLAIFAGTRYYGRSALFVAVILVITVVSAGVINDDAFPLRYRFPVNWAIYLLAAAGAAGVFSMVRAVLRNPAGRWRGLWPMPPVWPTIRRGQLPVLVALLATAVVLAALAAGHQAFTHRPQVVRPLATLGSAGPPLSALLAAARATTPQLAPAPRAAVLLLAADQSVDVVGPVEDRPDGQRDHAVLLALGQEVHDQRVTFVELRAADGTLWDTTGWYRPLLVFQLEGGAVLSPRAVPGPVPPQLLGGDHLLLLAAARSIPPDTPAFREVTLHFRGSQSRTYPIDPVPVPASRVAPIQALMPEQWLARYAAPDARVAVIHREAAMIMAAHVAPYAALESLELPADDRAAIRKWLHAETLQRHAIQYVWGHSASLKGEAATAVLDPTRLRPVLLHVEPGECPVRWRGLFVVATAAAATAAPLVPLTIPHPLGEDEFQGALRFEAGVAGTLAPGAATTIQLEVTNRSTQRWYGTCSTRDYPVGVAVEGRRSPEASWTLIGEALLTDDLPAGATAAVAVEITAPREVGRYELRVRLVQRPDRVSPATPAMASLVVSD